MFKIICISLIFLGTISTHAKVTSIKDFAQNSQFKSIKISPDGKYLAFTYEEDTQVKLGTMRLVDQQPIYSFGVGKNRAVTGFWWAHEERLVFIGQDRIGNLDGQYSNPELYAMDYDGKKQVHLGHAGGIDVVSMLKKDRKHIITAKYRFQQDVKLQRRNIYKSDNEKEPRVRTGMPVKKGSLNSNIWYVNLDEDDNMRVAIEYDKKSENDYNDDVIHFHTKPPQGEWQTLELNTKTEKQFSYEDLGFNATSNKFYFASNHDTDDKGTTGLFEYNFETQKIQLLFRHPDVDIISGVYSSDNDLIGVYFEPGYPAYHYLNDQALTTKVKQHQSLRSGFKNQEINIGEYSRDNELAVVRVYSDKQPSVFYLFNKAENKLSFLANSRPQINPKNMAAVEPFTMQARDKLKMYGQMTIPPGKELKNLPMVIYPHGGPYGPRDRWHWQATPQLLASRGYLVMQLDYRGSGGYGQSFEEAGYHEWGAKMQDDLTDVTLWAINQGYADKNKVCIFGSSYGGYAALQGTVKEPDLYQCAISEAGTYDLAYHMKSTDMFKGNKKRRDWFFTRMLGENFEELQLERSPIHHLEKLKAKLLIIHGKKDVRVTIGNAKRLEKKLKAAGKPYETFYGKNEGHGFRNVSKRIERFEKILDFLDDNIGN